MRMLQGSSGFVDGFVDSSPVGCEECGGIMQTWQKTAFAQLKEVCAEIIGRSKVLFCTVDSVPGQSVLGSWVGARLSPFPPLPYYPPRPAWLYPRS